MKALRLIEIGRDLTEMEIPVPQPGNGEVLIQPKAIGLCHSDLHFISGQIHIPRPLTLGHEIAGIVKLVGPGVTEFTTGDRVAVFLGDSANESRKTMDQMIPGISTDGGLAEYVNVLARNLVRIPDNVNFKDAAVATDAIASSHHAVKNRGKVEKGMKVGIIGLGGLGLNGMKIALLAGAQTLVADIDESKLALARNAGASGTAVNFMEFKGEDPDVILDFVGKQETLKAAQRVIKYGGRIVLVGLGDLRMQIHGFDLASREIELVGSFGSSYSGLKEVMELLSNGDLKMEIETIRFEEVNEALHRLNAGKVKGRLVVDMDH